MHSYRLSIFLLFTLAHSQTAEDVDSDHDVREVTRIPFKSMSSCRRRADFSDKGELSHVPDDMRKLFDWSNYQVSFDEAHDY